MIKNYPLLCAGTAGRSDAECGVDDLRLFLRVYLRVTRCSSRARLAADDAIVKALEVHLQERSGTHVKRLFLYPEPGCSLAVFLV